MKEYYSIRLARIQKIIDYILSLENSDKRRRQLENFCQLYGLYEQRLNYITN